MWQESLLSLLALGRGGRAAAAAAADADAAAVVARRCGWLWPEGLLVMRVLLGLDDDGGGAA